MIKFNGKEYALTEQAYYVYNYGKGFSEFYTDSESGKIEYFTAKAVDENENSYQLFWKIVNPDADLEEDMCDWDKVSKVEVID